MQVTAYLHILTECVPVICVLKVLSLDLLIVFGVTVRKGYFV